MPFLSPEDHLEQDLDLRRHLVRRPAATFFLRVRGEGLAAARVHDGDLLVVDRSLEPADGDIVVGTTDGRFVVRRVKRAGEGWVLDSQGPNTRQVAIDAEAGVQIWGVVVFSITEQCRR